MRSSKLRLSVGMGLNVFVSVANEAVKTRMWSHPPVACSETGQAAASSPTLCLRCQLASRIHVVPLACLRCQTVQDSRRG